MDKVKIKIGKEVFYSVDMDTEYTLEREQKHREIYTKYFALISDAEKKKVSTFSLAINNPYENEVLAVLFKKESENSLDEKTFKKLSKYFKENRKTKEVMEVYTNFLQLEMPLILNYIRTWLPLLNTVKKDT